MSPANAGKLFAVILNIVLHLSALGFALFYYAHDNMHRAIFYLVLAVWLKSTYSSGHK